VTTSDNVVLKAGLRYIVLGLGEIVPLYNVVDGICACSDWHKQRGACTAGKHPRSAEGKRLSSTDEVQVRTWLERQWPNRCNLGLLRTRASGPVVDVDPKHGGYETLAALERQYGPLPTLTPRVRTGSGGLHIYLAHPEEGPDIRSSIARDGRGLGPGVDLIGIGAYTVSPPSTTDKGGYAWLEGCGPDVQRAPIPARWLPLLQPATRTRPSSVRCDGRAVGAHGDPTLPIGQAAWQFVNEGVKPGQQRWRALSAIRNLLAAGKSVDEVLELVWQGLERSPQEVGRPAWTREEVRQLVEDLEASDPPPLMERERTPRLRVRVPIARPRPVGVPIDRRRR
jgi:hypothetical protein